MTDTSRHLREDLSVDQQLALRTAATRLAATHNAGRSQMALGFFTHLAGDQAVAWAVRRLLDELHVPATR
jgi:arsenate reductase